MNDIKQVKCISKININKYYYLESVWTLSGVLYFLYYKTPKHYVTIDLSDTPQTFAPEYRKSKSSFLNSLRLELEENGSFYEFNTREEAVTYSKKLKLKDKLTK